MRCVIWAAVSSKSQAEETKDSIPTQLAAARDAQSEAASLSRSLSQKRSGLERWRKDYEDGLLSRSEYYQHRIRLSEEIEALTLRLQDAEQEANRLDPHEIQEAIQDVDLWAHPAEMKALLRQIGMRIVHTNGHVEISLGR